MRVITIYRAFDGTEFNSAEECAQYENDHSTVHMWDERGTTGDSSRALVLYLGDCDHAGGNCFIDMCDEPMDYAGIEWDEDFPACGWWIWDMDEHRFVALDETEVGALRIALNEVKEN